VSHDYLVNPATRWQPALLSVMAIGAGIPEGENWAIVDGNRPDIDVLSCISDHVSGSKTGQLIRAGHRHRHARSPARVPLTREVKKRHPHSYRVGQ
jgi:hypothetical protein